MTNPVENQLKNKFPLRPIEDLNTIKSKIDLGFLTEKSEVRSKITATARQEFKMVENTYIEFMNMLHENGFEISNNSEVVSSLKLYRPTCQETQSYLAPVLSEFYHQTYYIKPELQEIYNKLHMAYCELRHQAYAYEKGEKGEEYIKTETACLNAKCKSLYNIRIPSDISQSNSAELDCVFATSKGLIVAEVKTLGSELDEFVVSQDGLWTKIHDGYEEILSNSPSRQNMLHCLAVEKFFEEHGISRLKVIPIILWASKAKIKNHSCATIIRPEMLYDFIEQSSLPEKYDTEFQEKISNLLIENDLGDNTFTIKTYNQKNNILEITKDMMQFMADNYNAAKNAITYKPEYPLSTIIGNTFCIVLLVVSVITLIVMFFEQIVICFGAFLLIACLALTFDFLSGI